MKNPLIVINLKTYKQGKETLKLAKIIQSFDKDIILGVQSTDIFNLSNKTKLRLYSQHVDPFTPGRNTGFTLPLSVKQNGAHGTFLNHSEHKINLDTIKKSIKICKDLKLKTMVFANSLSEAKKIEKLKPDYIIYEPKELVAGNVSVSEKKPEFIKKIAKNIKVPILVGAGIHSKKDVEVATKLGAKGVALSSAITTTRNPQKKLKELFS
jgi:triosephosphate isomerase (TIM)